MSVMIVSRADADPVGGGPELSVRVEATHLWCGADPAAHHCCWCTAGAHPRTPPAGALATRGGRHGLHIALITLRARISAEALGERFWLLAAHAPAAPARIAIRHGSGAHSAQHSSRMVECSHFLQ
jgi:hypothetical protein